jgi:agmatinase
MDHLFSIPRYLGSDDALQPGQILLGGVPYDCTSSFRSGSRFAMREIRSYSQESIESYSMIYGRDTEDIAFFDLGDLPVMYGDAAQMVELVQQQVQPFLADHRFIGVGGEHLVSYPLVLAHRAVHGDFTIVHLDAHADLRQELYGDALSHASVMKLCLDAGVPKLIQQGIRSGIASEEELRRTDPRIHACARPEEIASCLSRGEKVYLSIDVDYFDPAFVPGTGTPEAGGYGFEDFITVLNVLRTSGVQLIGADVVELAPELDPSKVSTTFCAKLLRELIVVMDELI